MNDYVEITIETGDTEQREILIAALSAIGYEGFEESDTQLKAFIQDDQFAENELTNLSKQYAITYCKSNIKRQNWNEVWESNFEPVQVDDFVGIRAGFHPSFTNVAHEIVITPKMSFGTGHHATTYMVMQLMRNISFTDKTVFDFGTGTGILAILAEKLDATSVLAVDNDDWCIENATENISINQCNNIKVEKINILSSLNKFDIILANINKNIILENIVILKEKLAKNGQLVLSGLLKEDEDDIHIACKALGLQHKTTLERSGWIAIWYF